MAVRESIATECIVRNHQDVFIGPGPRLEWLGQAALRLSRQHVIRG
jgi:hypothetical protein